MFSSIKRWWAELGYSLPNDENSKLKIYGIRPFRKRWFWFIVDDSETAVKRQKDENT